MKLKYALIAESATVGNDGLFSLLNGGMEWVAARQFPATSPHIVVLAVIMFEPEECGKTYSCAVRIVGPHGTSLSPDLAVELKPNVNVRDLNHPSSFVAHYHYDGFTFPEAGNYQFSFVVQDKVLGSILLSAFEER